MEAGPVLYNDGLSHSPSSEAPRLSVLVAMTMEMFFNPIHAMHADWILDSTHYFRAIRHRVISTPAETFDEWHRLPVDDNPKGSPFIVRRAQREDFDRIYDVVDAAFGSKRPRDQYDWLYLRNPMGTAHCWIVEDRETGTILKSGAGFPWPIWRGTECLRGSIGGDAATLPEWQRKGLSQVRRSVRSSHPWYHETCGISGPNAGSRAVIHSAGNANTLMGRLRGGVVLLRSAQALAQFGAPSLIAKPFGFVSDALLANWRTASFWRHHQHASQVEEIPRFNTGFDAVTLRHMSFSNFWCPHNADFLNWRYIDHPNESYVALALVENDEPIGYAVILLNGDKATLSEFVVGPAPIAPAIKLLRRAMAVAEEAGCIHLNFFASPAWRHWRLFHRAGFLPYRTSNHFEATCKRFEPEVHDLRNWQITPGDRDYH